LLETYLGFLEELVIMHIWSGIVRQSLNHKLTNVSDCFDMLYDIILFSSDMACIAQHYLGHFAYVAT